MGSRAVVVLCRTPDAARRRFGVVGDEVGIIYTRTGRRFFDDGIMERELLSMLGRAMDASSAWDRLATDWVVLDCELMPWSAKAQALIRQQYAAVGAAAGAALPDVLGALGAAKARGVGAGDLEQRFSQRRELVGQYVNAYRRYCWPVSSLGDLRLAPFHVMASDGALHTDKDHLWHMEVASALCAAEPSGVLFTTAHRVVDLADAASEAEATAWWEEMTSRSGEGMVVKPLRCRRISSGCGRGGLGAKRSLAMLEFALGVEGLERFVKGEALRRVHECVFGVLALESEPVDTRL